MMAEKDKNDKTDIVISDTKISRRKAVKTIAGGITAFATYQYLPAKWETPIIESIFIPAHAQTSGVPPEEKPDPPDPPGPDPTLIHELVSIEKGSTSNDILATFNPPTGGSLSGFYRIEFLNVNASATRAIQASVTDTTRSIQVNVPNDWSPTIAPSPGDEIRVSSFTTTPEYAAVDSSSSIIW